MPKEWTKEEEEILRKNYPRIPWWELSSLLSKRSRRAIRQKATKMGLEKEKISWKPYRWTPEKDEELVKRHTEDIEKLAEEFGTTRWGIVDRITKLRREGKIKTDTHIRLRLNSLREGLEIVKKLSLEDVIYIAGIVDGEGCLVRPRDKKRPGRFYLVIYNTDENLIGYLREKLGNPPTGTRLQGRKTCYKMGIAGLKALPLLEAIEPYTIVKRDKIREAISFLRSTIPDIEKHYWNPFDVSICWFCGKEFRDSFAVFHQECQTLICPHCSRCFCNLSSEAQEALDREMYSIHLWSPFTNPKKRKKRSSNIIRGVTREDFLEFCRRYYPSLLADYEAGRISFELLKSKVEADVGLVWIL